MDNRRKGGLNEEEMESLATLIASKVPAQQHSCHLFDDEEVATIKGFLKTKKAASKLILILVGTFILWALKDIYEKIHVFFQWGTK